MYNIRINGIHIFAFSFTTSDEAIRIANSLLIGEIFFDGIVEKVEVVVFPGTPEEDVEWCRHYDENLSDD